MIRSTFVLAVAVLAASGCVGRFSESQYNDGTAGSAVNPMTREMYVPPLDPTRKVSEQDCGKPVEIASGNLMCKEVTEAERRRQAEEERQRRLAAERRAQMEEEERQAKAQAEIEARDARVRAERERAAQLAAAEAARKAAAAEEERLAAERKAREERERQERAEAEAREAREAAERERQRLEQEWLAGRALLEKFVANYGKVEKFKDVAEPITGFLDKTR